MHIVIIIPGLGDQSAHLRFITKAWKKFGLETIVYPMGWNNGEHFAPKMQRLLAMIDEMKKRGDTISLIGCSAGGSAAINVFIARKKSIHRVINDCGRLRIGTARGFRSFVQRTRTSPAFAESIQLLEKTKQQLTRADREKIMTIRPIFDEVVPGDTVPLDGAYNMNLPTIGHSVSIILALTIFSQSIISFLTEKTSETSSL